MTFLHHLTGRDLFVRSPLCSPLFSPLCSVGVRLNPRDFETLKRILSLVRDIDSAIIELWAREELTHKRAAHPRGGGLKPTAQSIMLRKALGLGLDTIDLLLDKHLYGDTDIKR